MVKFVNSPHLVIQEITTTVCMSFTGSAWFIISSLVLESDLTRIGGISEIDSDESGRVNHEFL